MTVRDIARYLHCHQSTVYRLLKQRELPSFRLGGSWRFRLDLIDEWIGERTKVGPRQGDDSREGDD